MDFWHIFALLIFGHCVADYPGQGDFLAKAKNHIAPVSGVPWYQALGAHSIIQGGVAGIITGSLFIGLAETVLHVYIDYIKSDGGLTYNRYQAMHVACKLMWAFMFANQMLPITMGGVISNIGFIVIIFVLLWVAIGAAADFMGDD